MKEEYLLEKINETDKNELALLALETENNKRFNAEFIQHWYFDNPSNSFSLWKVVVNNKIEGYATSNNFKYKINGQDTKVAMPQNVLTSLKTRGKGLFNKLYFKTEADNINEKNINVFLTFTNSLSTPIFINKFNYLRGKCPIVFFNFFSIANFFRKDNFRLLKSIDEIDASFFRKAYHFDNAAIKDESYYKWRYHQYTKKNLHIIAVFDKKNILGYSFLKVEKRRGIKFLILMDIIAIDLFSISAIIAASFVFSSKKFYAGTVLFNLEANNIGKKIFRLKLKERFNFLVKGENDNHSKILSKIDFNMFFSDLDIV